MGKPSGVAIGGLVTGIVGAANALSGTGLLGNILGGGSTTDCASELAQVKSERYTDNKLLELYRYNEEQLAKRDTVTTGALIELGKESVRNEYARADIDALKAKVELNSTKICGLSSDWSALNERVTALAVNTDNKFAASSKEFYSALALEAERRSCGDDKLRCYVDATFVPGELVMPLDSICPAAQAAK